VISFLRGQLINHDTPPTFHLPDRNQIAPGGSYHYIGWGDLDPLRVAAEPQT